MVAGSGSNGTKCGSGWIRIRNTGLYTMALIEYRQHCQNGEIPGDYCLPAIPQSLNLHKQMSLTSMKNDCEKKFNAELSLRNLLYSLENAGKNPQGLCQGLVRLK